MNTVEAKVRFGRNLRAARKAMGLTQQKLAEAAGLDRSTVNQVETGQWTPMLDTAEKLARTVGQTIDQLLAS